MRHLNTRSSAIVLVFVSAILIFGTDSALSQEIAVEHVSALDAGATEVFALEVPELSILIAEIVVPGLEANVPWVELLPESCGRAAEGSVRYLQKFLTRQVVEVATAGTYCVRVGAVDPRYGLNSYALGVRLLAVPSDEDGSPFVKSDEDSGSDDDTEPSVISTRSTTRWDTVCWYPTTGNKEKISCSQHGCHLADISSKWKTQRELWGSIGW